MLGLGVHVRLGRILRRDHSCIRGQTRRQVVIAAFVQIERAIRRKRLHARHFSRTVADCTARPKMVDSAGRFLPFPRPGSTLDHFPGDLLRV